MGGRGEKKKSDRWEGGARMGGRGEKKKKSEGETYHVANTVDSVIVIIPFQHILPNMCAGTGGHGRCGAIKGFMGECVREGTADGSPETTEGCPGPSSVYIKAKRVPDDRLPIF